MNPAAGEHPERVQRDGNAPHVRLRPGPGRGEA